MSEMIKNIPPPYGPTEGMLQGIELMQRLSPTKVDAGLLKNHGVAPNNEYKVIGALTYLNLIDGAGSPTAKSRLLQTRGPSYLLALQDIVKTAYRDLFDQMDLKSASKDQIHNYFVYDLGLGVEMAAKASRFFINLCQRAGINLNSDLITAKKVTAPDRRKAALTEKIGAAGRKSGASPRNPTLDPSPTFVLAITPETADMDLDALTALFKKIRQAMKRAATDE
jgi:hypothetical protein